MRSIDRNDPCVENTSLVWLEKMRHIVRLSFDKVTLDVVSQYTTDNR